MTWRARYGRPCPGLQRVSEEPQAIVTTVGIELQHEGHRVEHHAHCDNNHENWCVSAVSLTNHRIIMKGKRPNTMARMMHSALW